MSYESDQSHKQSISIEGWESMATANGTAYTYSHKYQYIKSILLYWIDGSTADNNVCVYIYIYIYVRDHYVMMGENNFNVGCVSSVVCMLTTAK